MASHFGSLCPVGSWNFPLRIQRKGNFFNDDGFLDVRPHFESAAADLLREFDLIRHDDSFRSYRKLRDRQFSGTDRTTKVVEENNKFKIVMDIEGYADEDLQVKVVGPNQIAVEGKQQSGNGTTFFNKSFSRRFSLPGAADIELATSVLSSDNILTVNIPKKIQEIIEGEQQQSVIHTAEQQQRQQQQSIHTAKQDVSESSHQEQHQKQQLITKTTPVADRFASLDRLFHLPIATRDSFFKDDFFENVRQSFQKSVDEMMDRRLQRINSMGDAGVFRRVRESKEENVQATSVTEDEKQYKIVVDVYGFHDGDLKVSAVSDNALMIEGSMKQDTAYTHCSQIFKKYFPLPSSANIGEASSAVSTEGILTIIVPKNKPAITSGYQVPIRSEAAEVLTKVIKEEQKKETVMSAAATQEQKEREYFVPVVMEEKQSHTTEQKQTSKLCQDISSKSAESATVDQTKVQTSIQSRPGEEYYVPIVMDASLSNQTQTQTSSGTQSRLTESEVSSSDKNVYTSSRRLSDLALRSIPVSYKGSLYSDSVFEDAKRNFDVATQDAFNRFKKLSTKEDVEKTESKSITDVLCKQTAPTVLEDSRNYKIVLDVFGYDERELKVKISDTDEICVEGLSENVKEGTISKHSFHRTFRLPHYVDIERASTALSSESILTITLPIKNQVVLKTEKVIPIMSQIEKELEKSKEIKTTLVVDSSGIVQESRMDSKYPVSHPTTIPSHSGFTSTSTEQKMTQQSTVTSHQEATQPRIEEVTDSASVASTELDRSTSVTANQYSRDSSIVQGESEVRDVLQTYSKTPVKDISAVPMQSNYFNLPIVPKGHFFNDSFFQDSREMFELALRKNMNRFSRSSSFVDDLDFFRSCRQGRLSDSGSQLATLSEDDKFAKIVLDVQDFDERNLKIKVGDRNEILIEGEQEEKTGNSVSKKSFRKSFILPPHFHINQATSALSADGVLNIKIPKTPHSMPVTF